MSRINGSVLHLLIWELFCRIFMRREFLHWTETTELNQSEVPDMFREGNNTRPHVSITRIFQTAKNGISKESKLEQRSNSALGRNSSTLVRHLKWIPATNKEQKLFVTPFRYWRHKQLSILFIPNNGQPKLGNTMRRWFFSVLFK